MPPRNRNVQGVTRGLENRSSSSAKASPSTLTSDAQAAAAPNPFLSRTPRVSLYNYMQIVVSIVTLVLPIRILLLLLFYVVGMFAKILILQIQHPLQGIVTQWQLAYRCDFLLSFGCRRYCRVPRWQGHSASQLATTTCTHTSLLQPRTALHYRILPYYCQREDFRRCSLNALSIRSSSCFPNIARLLFLSRITAALRRGSCTSPMVHDRLLRSA